MNIGLRFQARRALRAPLLTAVLLAAVAAPAAAQELLTNGNFEAGSLTGWTVTTDPASSGSFVLSVPGATTPSGHPTAANPSGGGFYAVSDQFDPTLTALSQSFVVPAGPGTVMLHFQMFVNDWNATGPIIDPSGLLLAPSVPNQHARVDLLTSSATPFDTGAGVIRNFYLGVDPLEPAVTLNDYKTYDFDITPYVSPGGTFQIRFAQADTEFYLNQGVDNVSILFAAGVPTMNPWLLVAVGCLLVIAVVATMARQGRMQMA